MKIAYKRVKEDIIHAATAKVLDKQLTMNGKPIFVNEHLMKTKFFLSKLNLLLDRKSIKSLFMPGIEIPRRKYINANNFDFNMHKLNIVIT